MNYTKEFIELVKKNPDLPVLPFVDSDVFGGAWGDWLGDFGPSFVDEYTFYDGQYYFKGTDIDILADVLADKFCDDKKYRKTPDEKFADKMYEKALELEWTKAVIVHIEVPKDDSDETEGEDNDERS